MANFKINYQDAQEMSKDEGKYKRPS